MKSKITEGTECSRTDAIKNLKPFLPDYSSHLNKDREFFGYADCKTFAYFLNRCILTMLIRRCFYGVKVMLTLDDELHASIERMAEIQGLPKATLIRVY